MTRIRTVVTRLRYAAAVLVALLGLRLGSHAAADEFRPAYLQLVQRDATDYDVL